MDNNRLASWMEITKTTDRMLADKLAVDRSYICLLRLGKRPVTDAFRWRFATVYGFEMTVNLLGEPRKELA